MRIFGDMAGKLLDQGIQPIPIKPGTKHCAITGHKFYESFLSEKQLDSFTKDYSDWHIGFVSGSLSGIVGIDYDWTGPDTEFFSDYLIGLLPPTPLIKVGKKGWTRFYKYNDQVSRSRNFKMFDTDKGRDETFIDILSNKKTVVLPPSPHKDGGHYTFVNPDCTIYDLGEDLPELSSAIIDEIEELCKKKKSDLTEYDFNAFVSKGESRHSRVLGFINFACNTAKDLDDLTKKVLEYDSHIHKNDPKGPYFKHDKNIGSKSPYEAAHYFSDRICEGRKKWKAEQGMLWEIGQPANFFDEKGRRSNKFSDYAKFFNTKFPTAGKDIIDGVVKIKEGKSWEPIENRLKEIKAYAFTVGLQKMHIEDNLARWALEKTPKLLISPKRWNKKDLIAEVLSHIEVKDMPHEHFVELFKEWCGKIFSRLKDPMNQNKVIILRGAQGIGKDHLINFLFSPFGLYYSNIEIALTRKENTDSVSGLLVCNIGEFDETFKTQTAMFKSLITAPSFKGRAAYARKATETSYHMSFISSVNKQNILRDSSGNRRFLIFDVAKIRWGYDHCDQNQLLAQYYHLYRTGFTASAEALESTDALIKRETPVDTDSDILDELISALMSERWGINVKVPIAEFSDTINKIAQANGVGVNRVKTIAQSKGLRLRKTDFRYYCLDSDRFNQFVTEGLSPMTIDSQHKMQSVISMFPDD